jgi:flagellar protein FliO/FliZ
MKTIHYYLILSIFLPLQVMAESGSNIESAALAVSSPVEVKAVFQVIASLLFIVILIILLAWAYKRFGMASSSIGAEMKVIAAVSLGGKEKAVILQIGEEQVLLGVSPGAVRKLSNIKEPIKSNINNASDSFKNKLNIEIKKVIGR